MNERTRTQCKLLRVRFLFLHHFKRAQHRISVRTKQSFLHAIAAPGPLARLFIRRQQRPAFQKAQFVPYRKQEQLFQLHILLSVKAQQCLLEKLVFLIQHKHPDPFQPVPLQHRLEQALAGMADNVAAQKQREQIHFVVRLQSAP